MCIVSASLQEALAHNAKIGVLVIQRLFCYILVSIVFGLHILIYKLLSPLGRFSVIHSPGGHLGHVTWTIYTKFDQVVTDWMFELFGRRRQCKIRQFCHDAARPVRVCITISHQNMQDVSNTCRFS